MLYEWSPDQLLAQGVSKESLNRDIYSGTPANFCVALKYSTFFFFFNDDLETVIRSLLVKFRVKIKLEMEGRYKRKQNDAHP